MRKVGGATYSASSTTFTGSLVFRKLNSHNEFGQQREKESLLAFTPYAFKSADFPAGIIDVPIPWLSNANWAMAAVIIANIWYGVTFFVIMILAALQGVPKEMLEAAELDGCGKSKTLVLVIVPYIRQTLILIVLLRVIWITNFPDIIFGMTSGGPNQQTHILSSWLVQKITYDQDWGSGSALGLLILSVLLIFSVFYLLATRLEKESEES